MCISTPHVGATNVVTPVDTTAQNLELGSASIQNRTAGIFGRLALTGGQRGAAAREIAAKSGPTQGATSTGPGPAGTLGLPSDYLGNPRIGGLAKP